MPHLTQRGRRLGPVNVVRRQAHRCILDVRLSEFDPEAPPHCLVFGNDRLQPIEVAGVIADATGGRFLVMVVLKGESPVPRQRSVA